MPGKKQALLQLPVPGGKLSKLVLLNFGNLSGNRKNTLYSLWEEIKKINKSRGSVGRLPRFSEEGNGIRRML
jgi:hypothetical protein